MQDAAVAEWIRRKFDALGPVMDERVRRQWAASEAMSLAWGGVSAVAKGTGMSRSTIRAGIRELRECERAGAVAPSARVRRPGGGGRPLVHTDPGIVRALEDLVAPHARGDPMSPLRWTLKSTSRLAAELTGRGHRVSARTVAALLKASDYSLQDNRKTREGGTHADRDAQFGHINARVVAAQAPGQPVVSVDAKKKELVGDFKNGGREWRPTGKPEEVRAYGFIDPAPGKGRVTPYGVYDLTANEGGGERRDGPRHRPVRRPDDPEVVAGDGAGAVPGVGLGPLRERDQGQRPRTERGADQARRVPRRVELFDLPNEKIG